MQDPTEEKVAPAPLLDEVLIQKRMEIYGQVRAPGFQARLHEAALAFPWVPDARAKLRTEEQEWAAYVQLAIDTAVKVY